MLLSNHGKHPLLRVIISSECASMPASCCSSPPRLAVESTFWDMLQDRSVCYSWMRDLLTQFKPQAFGQLPMERVTPDLVFNHVGVDYARPMYTGIYIRHATSGQRWSAEYLTSLQKFFKWHYLNAIQSGHLQRSLHDVHPGKGVIIRVVSEKMSTGTYNRPVTYQTLNISTNHAFKDCWSWPAGCWFHYIFCSWVMGSNSTPTFN